LVRNKKNCEKQFDTFFQHNLTYLNQKILIFKTDPNCAQFLLSNKEYVKRRNGEHIEFIFLPKMGLLGSQASTEKKDQL
jgi:hypothetical protein